jgi:hypothetical protein
MRELKLIENAINNFSLDLKNITVLTEAASGNYVWTPVIAALSGANVFAYSKDSRYASFEEVKRNIDKIAEKLGIKNNLHIISDLNKDIINSADIITNTGFLRPLNIEKLQYCRTGVAISLMYETWEFRESDIDRNFCLKRHIPILGINESDSRLETIHYLGAVAKKALFLNNIEVFKSKIIILGFGKFANVIFDSLKTEVDFIEIWNREDDLKDFSNIDAFIIADHETKMQYIGINGLIDPKKIRDVNQNITIIHISGNIDVRQIHECEIDLYPENISKLKWMSLTTDFVGPKPVIDLHTAGLKAGEFYCRNYASFNNHNIAIQKCSEDQLIQVL